MPEHGGQREVPDDGLVGAEQSTQSALRTHHLGGAFNQLAEELVEFEVRQIREGQRNVLGGSWVRGSASR
ncbi:hypothetical protein GCM10020369_66060 [Cryptosporangium minutisporangium]|uniref:Uncharacterized protein n=1 Tax=Cryptosporangium minutisporangium TaxID=113569 RepID=A0ABP6T7W0_9ACTN